MATLYVENVPDDRYEALRTLAKKNRKSISAEILDLLSHWAPTEAEIESRQRFYERALDLTSRKPLTPGPFPSAEEMIREDRER